MADDTRIELNSEGITELLRSPAVEAFMLAQGEKIAAAAGPGVAAHAWQGGDRVRVSIWTNTIEAMLNEANDRTLTKALDAGRF